MNSFYYPQYQFISGITNAQQAVVTFTTAHMFTPGEIVGMRVTKPYGMFEINLQDALVLSITSQTITIDVDTTNYTPFIYPVSGLNTPPVCVPSASGVIPGSIPATVNLLDAFDNRPTI